VFEGVRMANRDQQVKKSSAVSTEPKKTWQQVLFAVFSVILILSWIAALIAK
jgi:hypothetical protein